MAANSLKNEEYNEVIKKKYTESIYCKEVLKKLSDVTTSDNR